MGVLLFNQKINFHPLWFDIIEDSGLHKEKSTDDKIIILEKRIENLCREILNHKTCYISNKKLQRKHIHKLINAGKVTHKNIVMLSTAIDKLILLNNLKTPKEDPRSWKAKAPDDPLLKGDPIIK